MNGKRTERDNLWYPPPEAAKGGRYGLFPVGGAPKAVKYEMACAVNAQPAGR
jgi:hypothetical protein